MYQRNYEVQILVNGSPVREFYHEGRYFIEGREKAEFKIKIKNNGAPRIVATPTVDGLSVLNGQQGSLESPGYVIGPYSSITIDGWRVTNEEVATFFFCDKERSYSARIGKNGNQGVIGVAIFREKPSIFNFTTTSYLDNYPFLPTSTMNFLRNVSDGSSVCNMNCSVSNGISNQTMDLGTGWGDLKSSTVKTVDFYREDTPDAVFEIFYATKMKLKEMGIKVDGPIPNYISAFPGNYCQPPSN
jgi:hypothetical protein